MSEVKRYDGKIKHVGDGGYVSYKDYAELKAQRDSLSTENVALKKQAVCIFNHGYSRGHESTVEGNYVHVYQSDMDSFHEDDVAEIMNENTPATSAYLNSVRADGAMACGIHLREWYDYQVEARAEEFAAQLRAGEQL